MKIVVGSDHAGYPMKAELLAFLREAGHEVLDFGSHDPAPVDFPDLREGLRRRSARAVGPWLAKDLIATYLQAKFSTAEEFRRRLAKPDDMDAGS